MNVSSGFFFQTKRFEKIKLSIIWWTESMFCNYWKSSGSGAIRCKYLRIRSYLMKISPDPDLFFSKKMRIKFFVKCVQNFTHMERCRIICSFTWCKSRITVSHRSPRNRKSLAKTQQCPTFARRDSIIQLTPTSLLESSYVLSLSVLLVSLTFLDHFSQERPCVCDLL